MNELVYAGEDGKSRFWRVWAESEDELTAFIVIEFGKVDGAIQRRHRKIGGKNIGRSNETTALEQARREAEKRYLDKKKSIDNGPISPMLAFEYTQHHLKINFPCIVQGKLDGERAIFNPKTGKFTSRLGNIFHNLEHISNQLSAANNILDGELYSDAMPFEKLSGLLKRKVMVPEHLLIKYHVFDVVSQDDFQLRNNAVNNISNCENVVKVNAIHCKEPDDADHLLTTFVNDGYEGIMLRNLTGPYEHKRSYNLQKYKLFKDSEFLIIDYKRENNTDAVVWICETSSKLQFSARPADTISDRTLTDEQAAALVGKFLTVRYQELTTKGVPRFPVGIRIRSDF